MQWNDETYILINSKASWTKLIQEYCIQTLHTYFAHNIFFIGTHELNEKKNEFEFISVIFVIKAAQLCVSRRMQVGINAYDYFAFSTGIVQVCVGREQTLTWSHQSPAHQGLNLADIQASKSKIAWWIGTFLCLIGDQYM